MSLIPERHAELKRLAIQLRRLVVESVYHAGAGHLGGPMSAAEMLVALYFEELNIDPETPRDENCYSCRNRLAGSDHRQIFTIVPTPSTVVVMTSPATKKRLSGIPTPEGVPVKMRSPGSKVMTSDR